MKIIFEKKISLKIYINEISILLLKRIDLSRKIGAIKKKDYLKIKNRSREKEILDDLSKNAGNKEELSYLRNIFKKIMKESRKVQR